MRRNLLKLLICLVAWASVGPRPVAEAQIAPPPLSLSPAVDLRVSDPRAISAVQRFEQLVTQAQWEDAADLIVEFTEQDSLAGLRWAQSAGGSAAAGPASLQTIAPLKTHLLTRVSQLADSSPELLAAYRRRIDPLAEQRYAAALQSDDALAWKSLMEECFLSRRGDEAAWRWGGRLLAEGRCAEARRVWESLHPALRTPAGLRIDEAHALPGAPLWLAMEGELPDPPLVTALQAATPAGAVGLCYPDTDLDLAEIRARLAWISVVEGALDRARREVALLEALHPQAEGVLGGKPGKWTDLLRETIQRAADWPEWRTADRDWPTFAGSFTRAPAASLDDWDPALEPAWTADLQPVSVREDGLSQDRIRPGEGAEWGLAHHPIVVGEWVVIAQSDAVRVLRLETGKPAFASPLEELGPLRGAVHRRNPLSAAAEDRQLGSARWTLSSEAGLVLTRWGDPRTALRSEGQTVDAEPAQILGMDLQAEGRLGPGFPWEQPAGWRFEGSPVLAGDRAYVALRRQEALAVELAVECRSLTDGGTLWRTEVLSAGALGQGRWSETSHHLLTLSDNVLYYNTQHGAVAAIDAEDGALRWIWSYPRTELDDLDPDQDRGFLLRDPSPCVAWRDMLFVAPADQRALFALDAAAGRLIWACDWIGADAVHVHGVAGEQLLVSGNHAYWVDVRTGLPRGVFPPRQRQAPGFGLHEPIGHGRGLLTSSRFYWPTRDRIYVFAANTRETDDRWTPLVEDVLDLTVRQAKGGHLIPGGGVMLIAAEDKLYAFP